MYGSELCATRPISYLAEIDDNMALLTFCFFFVGFLQFFALRKDFSLPIRSLSSNLRGEDVPNKVVLSQKQCASNVYTSIC